MMLIMARRDHFLRCTCIEFIVLAHPPKPSQPCEGALDDPATRQLIPLVSSLRFTISNTQPHSCLTHSISLPA